MRQHDPAANGFITGLGIAQIISWGSLYYSFPQIAEAMRADLGLPRAGLYGAAALGIILSGVAAYPVGRAIDRGHGRWLMAGGSAIAGALLCAWSTTDRLVAVYLVLAGIGLTQAATLYEPAFAVVARRFGPTDARRGITALTLWGGFASTVFIPLVEALIGACGWRAALVTLGALNLTLCTGLYAALIRPGRDRVITPRRRDRAGPGSPAYVLRDRTFWLLAISFVAHAGTFSVLTYHLYPLLLDRGLRPSDVVMALAVIGPAQVAGRIAVRVLVPAAPARVLGSVVVAGFPLSVAVLFLPGPGVAGATASAAVYGAANGVMTIVRGLAVPEMISRHHYGAINGLLTAPSLVVRALAPLAGAALWALSGSYTPVLASTLVIASITAGAFWLAAARPATVGTGLTETGETASGRTG